MEMEIGSETMVVVDGFFSSFLLFMSRGVSLYRGPFTKVVLFDREKAAASIRRQLYGWTRIFLQYSWLLDSMESSLEPELLWVVWNFVSLTLIL